MNKWSLLFFASFLAVFFCLPTAHADVIMTLAGTGVGGYSGDGGLATEAQLNAPFAVRFVRGEVLIADSSNHIIRKVGLDGKISTIAGVPGVPGFSGDGGPALEALLNSPLAIAPGGTNLGYDFLIADTENNRIRGVDADGNIFTIAGNGLEGFNGDGIPATEASLFAPTGIAPKSLFPNSEIFIADTYNQRVRKFQVGGPISTVAGTGVFQGWTTDGIPAVDSALANPNGVAIDSSGQILIASAWQYAVRKVGNDGIISTLSTGFYTPTSVTTYEGEIFASDQDAHHVAIINGDGSISVVAGNWGVAGYNGDLIPANQATLTYPFCVDANPYNGDLYIADRGNHRVRMVDRRPEASFTISPDRGYSPLTVIYHNTTNSIAPSITLYSWSLADGSVSNDIAPVLTLEKGIYSTPSSLRAEYVNDNPTHFSIASNTGAICVGYIFSNDSNTATIAPYVTSYYRNARLYGRVWANPNKQDVDYTKVKSATLVVSQGKNKVRATLVNEGNGNFSGSVLIPATWKTGAATATMTITDRAGKVYTASQALTLY